MKTSTKIITIVVVVLILFVTTLTERGWKLYSREQAKPGTELISSVAYACNGGSTISADFYDVKDSNVPVSSGDMPVPMGSAKLSLSDGRAFELGQTVSADGARYANADESFVFWSKGNSALVLENDEQKSFVGCIEVLPEKDGLSQVYQNGIDGFTIRYPEGYSVDQDYKYLALGPGKDIAGVKFTIPESMRVGTNLSADSYVSVEFVPEAQSCSASAFLGESGTPVQTVRDGDMEYSVSSSSDAGAGNRYEEIVYALPGTNPCVAVRYFIHSAVLENYPAGTVTAFDRNALITQFDAIRRMLVIGR